MLVLIVDDNPMMRVLLERAVNNAGACEIDFVADGADALECYQQRGHDLILLDLNMPKMSGTDFLTRLQGNTSLKNTHVMMVTGNADRLLIDQIKYNNLKVDDLIVKPFDLAKLSFKIAEVMTKTRSRRRKDGPLLKTADPVTAAIKDKPRLTCATIDRGTIGILELTGNLTYENAAVINAVAKELLQLKCEKIVIDLDRVETIDNFGFGHILVICGMISSLNRKCYLSFGRCPEKARAISLGITGIVPVAELAQEPHIDESKPSDAAAVPPL